MRVNCGGRRGKYEKDRGKKKKVLSRAGSPGIGKERAHSLIVYYDQRAESIKRNETECKERERERERGTENEAPTSDVSSST